MAIPTSANLWEGPLMAIHGSCLLPQGAQELILATWHRGPGYTLIHATWHRGPGYATNPCNLINHVVGGPLNGDPTSTNRWGRAP